MGFVFGIRLPISTGQYVLHSIKCFTGATLNTTDAGADVENVKGPYVSGGYVYYYGYLAKANNSGQTKYSSVRIALKAPVRLTLSASGANNSYTTEVFYKVDPQIYIQILYAYHIFQYWSNYNYSSNT